jgi:predicted nucleotidyltransferase
MDVMATPLDLHPSLTLEGLRAHREEILRLARDNRLSNIRVVGSVARGDAGPDSDVDLLFDIEDGADLFGMFGFLDEVEQLLGVKVEGGEADAQKPDVLERLLADAVAL